eukprot:7841444-Alexandrium_andersonii.AAC.1
MPGGGRPFGPLNCALWTFRTVRWELGPLAPACSDKVGRSDCAPAAVWGVGATGCAAVLGARSIMPLK